MDWFGSDIALYDETEDEITARVTVNYHAMHYWALLYCRHVQILAPADLALTVKEDLQQSLKNTRTNLRKSNGYTLEKKRSDFFAKRRMVRRKRRKATKAHFDFR